MHLLGFIQVPARLKDNPEVAVFGSQAFESPEFLLDLQSLPMHLLGLVQFAAEWKERLRMGEHVPSLSKADLREAKLRSTDLIEAKLSGADLRGANLRGAFLSGANLSEAILSEQISAELTST